MMDLEKSLTNVKWKLILEQPFYGLFLAELNNTFLSKDNPLCQTAAVGGHRESCNVQLLINSDFWENQLTTDGERSFILKHEVNHIMYEHIFGAWDGLIGDEKMLGNIAMDMFINQNLDYQENMPKNVPGCLPDSYPQLKLKWGEGTEYYFTKLKEAKDKKQQSAQKGENGGKGTCGDKKFDQVLEGEAEADNWHKTWDQITQGMGETEKDLLRKQLQQTIESVAEEVEKNRGEIPAHLREAIKRHLVKKQPIANWRAIFRQFMGKSQLQEHYRTRKRENTRFPEAPANRHKHKQKVVFCIDESGSMSERELMEANSELYHVWKAGAAVTIVHWDTYPHFIEEYTGKLEIHRHCAGGTYASGAIEWVNQHRNDYDVCIIATDGYIESEPIKCNVPCMWLITSGGSLDFHHHGKKLKMNPNDE